MDDLSKTLCFTGILMFLFSLLLAFLIPFVASPRLGVSAHTTGIESGVALIAIGLLWPHLHFWNGFAQPTAHLLWISLYLVFAGMALGAVWATGRSLPIAGGGISAAAWQELTVRALLTVGSVGSTAAIIAVLVQWRWTVV
jgi:hydroxylaminobenzene mutase